MDLRGRRRRRLRLVLLLQALVLCLSLAAGGAAAASPATASPASSGAVAAAAAAPPGIVCERPRDRNGNYTGTARCPVRSAAWTYFQAYLTYFDDCSQVRFSTSTIRMQILARRGATGVHIGGVWVVFQDGSKRFGSMRFDAIDGAGRNRNGAWNSNGLWSADIADLYSNGSDPIRYGVTPSTFVGMTTASNRDPLFQGQFAMSNAPSPNLRAECRLLPLSVVFTK